MDPVDLTDLRSVPELRDFIDRADRRLGELNREFAGQPFSDDARSEFAGLVEQRREAEKMAAELDARHAYLGRIAQDPRRVEREDPNPRPWRARRDPERDSWHSREVQRAHDAGLRALEDVSDRLDRRHGERMERLVQEKDPLGSASRYLATHGDPAYESAFAKMLADPQQGHLRFSGPEVEAVRRAAQVEVERAMGSFTGSAGGFGLPIIIDPTIVLVSAGVLNPLRDLARVDTIESLNWRGVSSDGVVAAFGAEAAEASDNSPTLAQPQVTVQRASAFVPFSIEVQQDYPGLLQQLGQLIADAKNVLEASAFLTGSGTNQPVGLLTVGTSTAVGTALTTTQRVQTATVATYAYADNWAFKQAIPVRFLADAQILMHPVTLDTAYQLSPAGSTTLALQMPQGRNGPLCGLGTAQLSTVATGSTTGTKIAVMGDFDTGFRIIDRIGLQVELVAQLFGATNRFPTGQRGLFSYWRTGCTAIGTGSAAGCALRYGEVK
jgi:HK97 family phage major capsid protein